MYTNDARTNQKPILNEQFKIAFNRVLKGLPNAFFKEMKQSWQVYIQLL